MTESCNPITHFSILVLTFITSDPLYLSYFIFFSPYLLKLLSFLSPLFLTTLLLSFTFLTLLERLRPDNKDVHDHYSDDLEIYDIVFGNSDHFLEAEKSTPEDQDVHKVVEEEKKDKRLENFLQILDQFERMSTTASSNVEKKTKKNVLVVEQKDGGSDHVQSSKMRSSSHSQSVSFSSVGSMRKEKEWNRTLACKLFEERHHDGGGQGMDSLWETYEDKDSNCLDVNKTNSKTKMLKKNKKKKKSELVDDQDEEEGEIVTGQLCCLQALKMSTGKMNLGMMRKPSLVKISKAVKGLGWLHSFSKHSSKKVHNTDNTRYY